MTTVITYTDSDFPRREFQLLMFLPGVNHFLLKLHCLKFSSNELRSFSSIKKQFESAYNVRLRQLLCFKTAANGSVPKLYTVYDALKKHLKHRSFLGLICLKHYGQVFRNSWTLSVSSPSSILSKFLDSGDSSGCLLVRG